MSNSLRHTGLLWRYQDTGHSHGCIHRRILAISSDKRMLGARPQWRSSAQRVLRAPLEAARTRWRRTDKVWCHRNAFVLPYSVLHFLCLDGSLKSPFILALLRECIQSCPRTLSSSPALSNMPRSAWILWQWFNISVTRWPWRPRRVYIRRHTWCTSRG